MPPCSGPARSISDCVRIVPRNLSSIPRVFSLTTHCRAADTLPAARGPVWYSFPVGSRRYTSELLLFHPPPHWIVWATLLRRKSPRSFAFPAQHSSLFSVQPGVLRHPSYHL